MKRKVLNLINQNESEVKYHVDHYPDGQIQLVLDNLNDNKCELYILTRIKSSDDLFILMQLSDIIQRRGLKVDTILITYLLAARTDRLFNMNTSFTLKIVADIINSFNASDVRICTPHSEMSLNLIKNSTEIEVINQLSLNYKGFYDDVIVVTPDEGAADRLHELIYYCDYDLIVCNKKRGADGSVQSVELEMTGILEHKDFSKRRLLVWDDLCDGGGTFLAIAPKLRELKPKSMEIAITHAIQYSGIEKLSQTYDKVYITDSYNDWKSNEFEKGNVVVMPLMQWITEQINEIK